MTCRKNRNNIVFKNTCGEKRDADYQAVEDYLKDFIKSSNYVSNDVYNVNETGLYYRVLPDSTFDFKGTTINGCKKQMQRLTKKKNNNNTAITILFICSKCYKYNVQTLLCI